MDDSLDKVHYEFENFLVKISSSSIDRTSLWSNLRSFLIDLVNKNKRYEPVTKTLRLIAKIKSQHDFNTYLSEKTFYKLFPSTQYKYHLESKQKEHCSNVKIRPPTTEYTSKRHNYKANIKEIDLTRFNPRRHSSKSVPTKEIEEESRPNTARRLRKIETEFLETPKIENSQNILLSTSFRRTIKMSDNIKDDMQAIQQFSAANPETDDTLFHYGSLDHSNRYSFDVVKAPPISNTDYQTISRKGVFQISQSGASEFIPIDVYIRSKIQYGMLQPIQLFSQFKTYKTFFLWKLRTEEKKFLKQKNTFSVIGWNARPSFPNTLLEFRKILYEFYNLEFFLVQNTNNHEFDVVKHIFDTKVDELKDFVYEKSKKIYKILDDFCFVINNKYHFMTTPRSIDFITAEKIPQALLAGGALAYKASLSIAAEREIEKQHKSDTEYCLTNVNHLKNFLKMCDKMMIEVFTTLFEREMNKLFDLFRNQNSEHFFRVFLVYETEKISFSPTLKDLTELFNNYIKSLVNIFDGFVRPLKIDSTGKHKIQKCENVCQFLEKNKIILNIREEMRKEIEFSYEDAVKSSELYLEPAHQINLFKNNWHKMREIVNDPQKFVQNLTDFTNLKESVKKLHSNYHHNKIILDARTLKQELIEITDNLIQDNNSILFSNFRTICENIIEDVKHIISTLELKGYNLENIAEFNLNISNAIVFIPELNKNTTIINGIIDRAIQCGELLLPVLSQSLEEVKEITNEFDKKLTRAQNLMEGAKIRALNELKEKQKEIDSKIKTLERQMKRQFAICNVNQSPEVAISDINQALSNLENVKVMVKDFTSVSSRMNYSDYDFSSLKTVENDLKVILHHWKYYQEFTVKLKSIIDKRMVDCNLPSLIEFINSYSERELRSVNHVLYDKMAYVYENIAQYLPFFTTISKIEMNDVRWSNICDICGLKFFEIKPLFVLEFLKPVFINKVDEIRDFIITMQQRENLMKHFNEMIEECSNLSFKFVNSKMAGKNIVTFPCLYDANQICENYMLYLKGLKNNDYFDSIRLQSKEWTEKLNIAIKILTNLRSFQTDYVYVLSITKNLFGSFHYPYLFQKLKFVNNFYDTFMSQVSKNQTVFSLVPEPEKRFNEQIDDTAAFSSKSSLDFVMSGNKDKTKVSNDDNQPITDQKNVIGELLVNCLIEGKKRCQTIMKLIHPLLDQQRQLYPRLYLCNDDELIGIIIACSNLRFSQNDFKPIFPAISKFHISMADSERLLGISNKLGETYSFSSEFIVPKLSFTELLMKIESELKNTVKGSISDCFSTRDYTDLTKLYEKYPLQAILVSESAFFKNQLNEIMLKDFTRNDFTFLRIKIEESIKNLRDEMKRKPEFTTKLANIISLKLRQREIATEIENHFIMDNRDFMLNKHLWINISQIASAELVTISYMNQSLTYGYEMIDNPSIIPLSDTEENGLSAMFIGMSNFELLLTKVFNSNRNLSKVFADFIGYLYFESENCDNLIDLISHNKIIYNITKSSTSQSFNDFYKIIENNVRQVKVNNCFKDIKLEKQFLVTFSENCEIPGYLKQRYRPIYLNKEPKELLVQKISEIREEIKLKINNQLDLDIISKSIFNLDPVPFIYKTMQKNEIYIKNKNRYFFNLPEYFLTGEVRALEDPISLILPDNLIQTMTKINNLFQEYELISPRSQSPDNPIRVHAKSLKIVSKSFYHFLGLFFVSLGEQINKLNFSWNESKNKKIKFLVHGYKPLCIEVYKKVTLKCCNGLFIEDISLKDLAFIMAQEKSLNPYFNEIIVYLESLIEKRKILYKENEKTIYLLMIKKLNKLRQLAKQNILLSELIEKTFNSDFDENEHFLSFILSKRIPLVINGEMSCGKRTFAKGFLATNKKPKDSFIYVSPFNQNINKVVFNKLKFVKQMEYKPNLKGGILWIVVFDYQLCSPEIKNFVKSFLLFRSIQTPENTYVRVSNIQLIITTTNPNKFCFAPCHFLSWEKVTEADVDQVDLFHFNDEILDNIKEFLKKQNLYFVKQFLSLTFNMTKISDISRIFSIYFGLKNTSDVFKLQENEVIEFQNNHFCVSDFIYQFNFGSLISEVIFSKIPTIIKTDEYKIFAGIKGTEFVVLDKSSHGQIFTSLVNISQTKNKKTFIIEASQIDDELFDILYFFLYCSEYATRSTVFDLTDLQIFKNYLNTNLTLEKAFETLKSYINFLIVCREDNYEKIPLIFRQKMPVLEINKSLMNQARMANNDYVNKLVKYTNLNLSIYDKFTQDRQKLLNEKTQDFIGEIQSITSFFGNLTSLRPKIDFDLPKDDDEDITQKAEQLDIKIKETKKKNTIFEEQIKDFTSKLDLIKKDLEQNLPNRIKVVTSLILKIDIDNQKRQVLRWISQRDQTSVLCDAFKDIFGYVTISIFPDPIIDGTKTNIVESLLNLNLEKIDPLISSKIQKYNNSEINFVIKENEITPITDIEIVDYFIRWFSVVIQIVEKNKAKNEISNEISNIKNRIRLNNKFLDGLSESHVSAMAVLKRRDEQTECPSWLLTAWKNDKDDVRKLFNTLQSAEQILDSIISEAARIDIKNKNFSAVQVAYQYGICSLSYEKRHQILKDCELQEFDTPFKLIEKRITLDLLNNSKSGSLNYFSSSTSSNLTSRNLSDRTSQMFNTLVIYDQLFFRSESDSLIDDCIDVYYDPQSIALQHFLVEYAMNTKIIYDYNYEEELINSIASGKIVFAFIDDLKKGYEFIDFVRHITLQIQAMHYVQYGEQRKPIELSFKLLIFTNLQDFKHPNIILHDYSASKLENTTFFEHLVCSYVNETYCTELIHSLRNVSSINSNFLTSMRRLVELSHESWPEYFENNTKMLQLRSNLEGFVNLDKSLNEAIKEMNTIEKKKNEFSKLNYLLRNVVQMANNKFSVFQLLSTIKNYLKNTKVMDQTTAINNLEEIILYFLEFLEPKERVSFLSNFEAKYLIEYKSAKDFLIEDQFPKLHERNIYPLLPQVVNHILQKLSHFPRTFFITASKSTFSFNSQADNPSIIIVDDLLPIDFIARLLYPEKCYFLTSFLLPKSEDFVLSLFNLCEQNGSRVIILFDDALPKWIIYSVLYYSNVLNFVDFAIFTSKSDLEKLPILPHAIYRYFSRPFTNNGVSSFLSEFITQNVNECLHYCGPLLLFFSILSHRNDFKFPMQMLIPTVNLATSFFEQNYFGDFNLRELWKNYFINYIETICGDVVDKNSLVKQIEYFFRQNEPSIPGLAHVDSQNSIYFGSEVPPTFNNSCMMLSFGDDISIYKNHKWKEFLGEKKCFCIKECKDGLKIEHVKLSNAYWNHDELTIIGTDEITIYATKSLQLNMSSTEQLPDPNNSVVPIAVYDGNECLGFIDLKCSGNPIQWGMASVRAFLPPR
ncbi:hypothetical protein TVAG_262920 [Trichomonas vaginalis G3]|uniref:Dynein heavy chain linker domain-containing protein n=1 Tax=Trichomonas vaginalis (strain ATCC PRA-98 / G3) TaxID=412133 RepID=A2FTC9_TRIV3|nr:dynein heavy chain family protein family [Trichomonas vaginalis G3]EAX91849.1 hypothetical protein TVAG_262920 [Trichomonas vaginalis G3]KAI5512607.1 dynein heavy chain family protein family [Trichomonas vaginalis G3]|eukprot:XP_001304779.1 hypothetical protein [Trichomonas vaginalis G3]